MEKCSNINTQTVRYSWALNRHPIYLMLKTLSTLKPLSLNQFNSYPVWGRERERERDQSFSKTTEKRVKYSMLIFDPLICIFFMASLLLGDCIQFLINPYY